MKSFVTLSIAAMCLVASAQATLQWRGYQLSEVDSLGSLPPEVQRFLDVGETGNKGISDLGGRFNSTDVVSRNEPSKRFMFGGMGSSVTVVVVENGGRAHWFEALAYERRGESWELTRRQNLTPRPLSLRLALEQLKP